MSPLQQYRYAVWYKANPRSAAYMRALQQEHFPDAQWVDTQEQPDWASKISRADSIVLLYPDSIGLGFGAVERSVFARKPGPATVDVVNGRRRSFRLDPSTRAGLRLRRILECSMLAEFLFVPVFIVVTPVTVGRRRGSWAHMKDAGDVRDWWRDNPMTYAVEHGRTDYQDGQYEMGTAGFFDRLDREFYGWNRPLHRDRPFDRLFPFADYANGAKVLEIGCGLGTLAMNWARNGAAITAVDLKSSQRRANAQAFRSYEAEGRVEMMDARRARDAG